MIQIPTAYTIGKIESMKELHECFPDGEVAVKTDEDEQFLRTVSQTTLKNIQECLEGNLL